jgi:predicted dehydrogenase
MATTEEDCKKINESVNKNGIFFCVCHCLRYNPVTTTVKNMLKKKKIGKILNIQHLEPGNPFIKIFSFLISSNQTRFKI